MKVRPGNEQLQFSMNGSAWAEASHPPLLCITVWLFAGSGGIPPDYRKICFTDLEALAFDFIHRLL